VKRYKPLHKESEDNYIKSNNLFRGWIDNKNNIIKIPRGEEHHLFTSGMSTKDAINKHDYIRFYSDKSDVVFECKELDNKTFRRIYDFFKKYLLNDTREIFIQDQHKMKQYKSQFKEWVTIKLKEYLEEGLRLSDFKSHAGSSNFTKKWANDRKRLKGAGNRSAKLVKLTINKKTGDVTFFFASEPTYKDKAKVTVKPSMGMTKSSDVYIQLIRVTDFFKWAKTTPNYKSSKQLSKEELKDIMESADIKVHCDDPSFWWQGDAWVVTQFDAAIIPCDIPPKHWRKYHNDDNFVCKHLDLLLTSIDFFLPQMTAMLNRYLKGDDKKK